MASHVAISAEGSSSALSLRRYWSVLLGVGVFTGVLNVLALAGSFYMLQVYDRVLPSRSIPTLIGLSLLLVGLIASTACLMSSA